MMVIQFVYVYLKYICPILVMLQLVSNKLKSTVKIGTLNKEYGYSKVVFLNIYTNLPSDFLGF